MTKHVFIIKLNRCYEGFALTSTRHIEVICTYDHSDIDESVYPFRGHTACWRGVHLKTIESRMLAIKEIQDQIDVMTLRDTYTIRRKIYVMKAT